MEQFALNDLLLLIVTGGVAGILAGMFGIGGGVILVPGLLFVFQTQGYGDYAMHMAVGTSLALIIPTGFSSAMAHAKRGALNKLALKRWALGIVIGCGAGSFLASMLDGETLQGVFAIAITFLALLMQIKPEQLTQMYQKFIKKGQVEKVDSFEENSEITPSAVVLSSLGIGVGTLSTLMGVGGATMSVPAMTLLGMDIRKSIGTAASLGIIISIPGAVGFIAIGLREQGLPDVWYLLGYIHLIAFAIILPASMGCAQIGVKIAHALPFGNLKRLFSFFMILVAIKMIWSVFG